METRKLTKEEKAKLQNSHICDSVGWSSKLNCYRVKRSFYYRHGMDADKLAAAVKQVLPQATILLAEEHWNNFPRDSYWLVLFVIPPVCGSCHQPMNAHTPGCDYCLVTSGQATPVSSNMAFEIAKGLNTQNERS